MIDEFGVSRSTIFFKISVVKVIGRLMKMRHSWLSLYFTTQINGVFH